MTNMQLFSIPLFSEVLKSADKAVENEQLESEVSGER